MRNKTFQALTNHAWQLSDDIPLQATSSPSSLMTDWLVKNEVARQSRTGDECEISRTPLKTSHHFALNHLRNLCLKTLHAILPNRAWRLKNLCASLVQTKLSPLFCMMIWTLRPKSKFGRCTKRSRFSTTSQAVVCSRYGRQFSLMFINYERVLCMPTAYCRLKSAKRNILPKLSTDNVDKLGKKHLAPS